MASRSPRFPRIPSQRIRPIAPGGSLRLVGFDFLRRRSAGGRRLRARWNRSRSTPADVYATFGVGNIGVASVIGIASAGMPAAGGGVLLLEVGQQTWTSGLTPDSTYVSPYGDPAPLCAPGSFQNADVIVAPDAVAAGDSAGAVRADSTVIPNPIDHETWDRGLANPLSPIPRRCRLADMLLGRTGGGDSQAATADGRGGSGVLRSTSSDGSQPAEPVLEAQVRRDARLTSGSSRRFRFQDAGLLCEGGRARQHVVAEGFPERLSFSRRCRESSIASLVVGGGFSCPDRGGRCFSQDLDGLCNFVRELWQAGSPPLCLMRARRRFFAKMVWPPRVADAWMSW